MHLLPDEPPAANWIPQRPRDLLAALRSERPEITRRPFVLAVDGRSAGGKTTTAELLAQECARTAVVHTDDLAWWEPMFGWERLLAGLLEQVRAGDRVVLRPPAWEQRGRPGVIEVPAGIDLLVVEGVGSSQRAVADLLDASLWVQSDIDRAQRRGIARDLASGVNGDQAQTVAFWHEWWEAERTFLASDRPWERADRVILGTPLPAAAAPGELLVAARP